MAISTIKKLGVSNTFEVKGEKFVIFKKELLDELLILAQSLATGEKLLKENKTRSFTEFVKSASRKK